MVLIFDRAQIEGRTFTPHPVFETCEVQPERTEHHLVGTAIVFTDE